MKFDEIVELLGEFGPYQRRIFFFACFPPITASIHALIPVFILAVPEFRCAIPGLSNDTYKSQGDWHQRLINNTLPWTDAIGDDESKWGSAECNYYKYRNLSNFDHGDADKVSCNRWVYDNSEFDNSFVTQENIVCDDKVLRSHVNMIYMGGMLVGSVLWGFVSDGMGRKTAFMLSLIVHICTSMPMAFAPNYSVFAALRFFNGVSNMGLFMCCFVLGMELVGKSWRAETGVIINFFWCFGMFFLCAVAYFVRDWQNLQLIFSSITFLYLGLYWIVPESPRWQISKGQVDKARLTLEKAAKVNGKVLPPGCFDSLEMENKTEKKGKLTDIFVSPLLAFRLCVGFANWLVVTMIYYGLTLGVGSLGGNVFVNFSLSAMVETLANMATLWAIPRVGRKRFHCFSMILGGTACLAIMIPSLIGNDTPLWVTLMLSNIGKFGATGGFSTIYIFTAELFPTSLRNTVVGASSMWARVGGIAAPYIADLGILVGGSFGTALPYVVFGAASLATGLLSLTLPETLNQPTPETIQDAINLGKSPHTNLRVQTQLSRPLLVVIDQSIDNYGRAKNLQTKEEEANATNGDVKSKYVITTKE